MISEGPAGADHERRMESMLKAVRFASLDGPCQDSCCAPGRLNIADRKRVKNQELRERRCQDDIAARVADAWSIIEAMAQDAYEIFHGLPEGSSMIEQVMNTSAGIRGWASARPCVTKAPAELEPIDEKKQKTNRVKVVSICLQDQPPTPRSGVHLMTKPSVERSTTAGLLATITLSSRDRWEMIDHR